MVEQDSIVKGLLEDPDSCNIIVGAGCSIDNPSNIAPSIGIIEAIIKFTCAKSEIENILGLEGLRFEILLEIIRNLFDNELKILEYLEKCDKPNSIHFYLSEMIDRGVNVITTNFDFLIEHAIIQSNKNHEMFNLVITEEDYRRFEDIIEHKNNGKKFLFKIHGSTKDILRGRDTQEYFLSLIKKLGSFKTEFNLFFVEPYKGVLFNKLFNKANIILIGYSGQNDFDIIPILKRYHKMRRIIWINHLEDKNEKEKITQIVSNREENVQTEDKIDQILLEIKNQNPNIDLIRIDTNLSNFFKSILNYYPELSEENFSLNFSDWLPENLEIPTMMMKYLIPHVIYFNFNRLEDSFRCGIRALEYIDSADNQCLKQLILNNIGWIYYKMGNLSEAIEHFKEAATIAQELGKKDQELVYLSNLGDINERIQNFPQALEYYKKAMALAENSGNLMEELRILNSVIEVYEILENYSDALKFSENALKLSERLGDLKKKAMVLNNIGSIYYKQNNLDLALDYFQQSEKIFRRINDNENISICLNNIGTVFQNLYDYPIALNKFEEAIEFDEKLQNYKGKTQHLRKIGEVYFDQNDYVRALDYFRDAIEISRKLKDEKSELELHNWIGKTFFFLKEYNNALKIYRDGLKIAEKHNDLVIKADFLNNIAGCYYMQLKYKDSLRYAHESLLTLKLIGMGKSIKAITLEKKILNIKSLINS
ncbi:MAG: tetratricopeptide repeat protein [Promethearchaeota archaeon]